MDISRAQEIGTGGPGSAVSLMFAAEHRPGVEAIPDPVWLELVANGLTFDLVGLSPGPPGEPAPCVHGYGLPANADPGELEGLTLRPGPHLAGGHSMTPVVRTLAWLAASLAQLDGVEAIAWHPARSWSAARYFRDGVMRWIEGGVFPGLGLTSLAMAPDGGMQSEGLALFTGQELRIEPELMADKAAAAKIGVRLIDLLVESGRIDEPQRIADSEGLPLRLEPSANGRFVRVWRG